MTTEYAVKYSDGTVGLPSSQAFCRRSVANPGSPKVRNPLPVAVVTRQCTEWVEERSEEKS